MRARLMICIPGALGSLALAGCLGTSRPARFYTLEPLEPREELSATTAGPTVAVGPIELPETLDRPQIVTRSGKNELVVSEFDRWGGSLDRQIGLLLASTLRERLGPRKIVVVPWRSAVPSTGTRWRLPVSISRFDGVPGRSVVLVARWELCTHAGGKDEALGVKDATVTEPVDGPGYDALVAAMQRALRRLGQRMADGLAESKDLASAAPEAR